MKLYLSSYRLGKKFSFLENWIKENGNKITVIPNALDDIDDKKKLEETILDRCLDIKKIGFDIEVLDLRNYFNKKEELNSFLEKRNSFYVLGGNVFILNRAMKLSGFDNYLINNIDNDNILYSGFSAGICILSKNLEGLDLVVDPECDPYNSDINTMKGIGIIDYLPVPHYKSDHPASSLIDKVIDYLDNNNLSYRKLQDGDVIIESTKREGK